ncbi:MAG: hypothetical protein A2096_17465 [Spirochaetes bacterium GWF1_41_5]|nr:MAG: hypothetical protein A2096_17465 [Spirochaetes bacterium GWF1_41_5]
MNIFPLAVLSCSSGRKFAERLIDALNIIIKNDGLFTSVGLIDSSEIIFANGEIKSTINDSVRGKDVYIVQLVDDPLSENSVNDNIFSLVTMINAAYNSDAGRITAVIPQFPYARQERKKGREAITAKIMANLLESSGADRVITLDIHAESIEGFFTKAKLENLHAGRIIINYVNSEINKEQLVVVAPDIGSAGRGRFFAHHLGIELAIIDKTRNYSQSSVIEKMVLVGNIKDKDVLLPDDMIATGGTLLKAVSVLKEKGANNVYIAAALPFFNGEAVHKFDQAWKQGLFRQVIGTDAVYHGENFSKNYPWYREISVAGHFGEVIYSLNQRRSVSGFLT